MRFTASLILLSSSLAAAHNGLRDSTTSTCDALISNSASDLSTPLSPVKPAKTVFVTMTRTLPVAKSLPIIWTPEASLESSNTLLATGHSQSVNNSISAPSSPSLVSTSPAVASRLQVPKFTLEESARKSPAIFHVHPTALRSHTVSALETRPASSGRELASSNAAITFEPHDPLERRGGQGRASPSRFLTLSGRTVPFLLPLPTSTSGVTRRMRRIWRRDRERGVAWDAGEVGDTSEAEGCWLRRTCEQRRCAV
ncbi:hypothetical protein SVAN01_02201 [Stagonosporopsis vannaccii]|nr:hypothetical protein SVAN01_02201 [Stagonosporopsis vannaccii]